MRFELTNLLPFSVSRGERLEIKLSLLSALMKKKTSPSLSVQLVTCLATSQGKPVAPIVLSPTQKSRIFDD